MLFTRVSCRLRANASKGKVSRVPFGISDECVITLIGIRGCNYSELFRLICISVLRRRMRDYQLEAVSDEAASGHLFSLSLGKLASQINLLCLHHINCLLVGDDIPA